jgi:cytochrome c oxidase subunit IV
MSSDSTVTDTDSKDPNVAAQHSPDLAASQAVHEGGHGHAEPTDRQYIGIALILAVLTAIEIAATEAGWFSGAPLVTILISLMVVKFLLVVGFFMHLRFDSRLFTLVFYIGVVFAVGLYGVMLATFHFWTG